MAELKKKFNENHIQIVHNFEEKCLTISAAYWKYILYHRLQGPKSICFPLLLEATNAGTTCPDAHLTRSWVELSLHFKQVRQRVIPISQGQTHSTNHHVALTIIVIYCSP